MILVIGSILALVLLVDLWLWINFPKSWSTPTLENAPKISVLVAVRNEAHNVPAMIQNLAQLDYPSNRMSILIGDDDSTDDTWQQLEQFTQDDTRFKLVRIDQSGALLGKARVIEQLIRISDTPYYLITDADVRVPSSWARGMTAFGQAGYGVWGGCTTVYGNGIWSSLQNLDWLLAQGMLTSAAQSYQTLAVSGTNMALSQQACQAIGGYKSIPYALTEDIGFLTAARASGCKAGLLYTKEVCARIPPQKNWATLLKQRARWTYGATKLPWPVIAMLSLRAFYLMAVIIMVWFNPVLAAAAYLLRQLVQWGIIKALAQRLNQSINLSAMLLFELYYSLVTLGGLILYLLPISISWKGRKHL